MDSLEKDLIEQVRARMAALEMTQEALAKQVFGEGATRQHINPYLTGARGLLGSNGVKILKALGLQRLLTVWEAAEAKKDG